VPLTSFNEFDHGSKQDVWFAPWPRSQLASFAGIWIAGWTGVRKIKTGIDTMYRFRQGCDALERHRVEARRAAAPRRDWIPEPPGHEALGLQPVERGENRPEGEAPVDPVLDHGLDVTDAAAGTEPLDRGEDHFLDQRGGRASRSFRKHLRSAIWENPRE
jgi:hypothetical protein